MKQQMKEERRRLQQLFEPFNRKGSWLEVVDGGERFPMGLVDSWTVTRLAPELTADGDVARIGFWLMWKAVGYDEGDRHTHSIRVIRWSQPDGYMIDLVDDQDREHHVELILPTLEPEKAASWKRWQRYRADETDLFRELDEGLLEQHRRIAEEWDPGSRLIS